MTHKVKRALLAGIGFILYALVVVVGFFPKWIAYSISQLWYQKILIRRGYFDHEYYLNNNPDLIGKDEDAVKRHYLRYGVREKRAPSPFFSPPYYLSRIDSIWAHRDPFMHYVLIGWHFRISPSSLFNIHFYLQHNRDVFLKFTEPLYHYLKYGALEGRSPNSQFDGAAYLKKYPTLKDTKQNPLLHYLELQEATGYSNNKDELINGVVSEIQTDPNRLSEFIHLAKEHQDVGQAGYRVIVPVYRNFLVTQRCLFNLLKSVKLNRTRFAIHVIDDCSPEEDLSLFLDNLAQLGLIRLTKNKTNLGFVATVNQGVMAEHSDHPILLNSDTEVYGNWLDRLIHHMQGESKVASVTPLSNNATILSYPRFLHNTISRIEMSYAKLDYMISDINLGQGLEIPTGVGFCMLMNRKAIDSVGIFDEKKFGKGYGEENDWCYRTSKKGWSHRVALDTFVFHKGSVSFLEERHARLTKSMQVLNRLHPSYHSDIQAFIQKDPIKEYRKKIDLERLKNYSCERNILMVSHNRGGGSERKLNEERAKFEEIGFGVFNLRPDRSNLEYIYIQHPKVKQLYTLNPMKIEDNLALGNTLKALKITEIQVHGVNDIDLKILKTLIGLKNEIGTSITYFLHDYTSICPRINLISSNNQYCGEQGVAQCNTCLAKHPYRFNIPIQQWRSLFSDFIRNCDRVVTPSDDARQRIKKFFPGIEPITIPHQTIAIGHYQPSSNRTKLQVAIIGAIGIPKGYDQLLRLAKYISRNSLPIQLTLVGYSMGDKVLEKAGVHIIGRYQDENALNILRTVNPDLVFLPSIWPETYSYVLDTTIQFGCPIMLFDIGAPPKRLAQLDYPKMSLLKLSFSNNPKYIVESMLRLVQFDNRFDVHRDSRHEIIQR